MGFIKLLIPALIACTCNAMANMFWKIRFDKNPFSLATMNQILELVMSWHIWAGIACYVMSMLLFFYMLSNFKLSSIMPVTCMTYVLNIVIAKVVFHESISALQLFGTGIILVGLVVLSQGSKG